MHGSSAVALSITYQRVIRKSKTAESHNVAFCLGSSKDRDLSDIPAIGHFEQRNE
jgi:hypothetical protein